MKITLVIYSMMGGGAERVMSILANYWATHGWDVTLMTLVGGDRPPFFQLEPQIKLKQLGVSGASSNIFAAIWAGFIRLATLRAAIKDSQPDVIISFMNTVNVLVLLATWNLNIPVLVSEHSYPGLKDANKIWQLLMNLTYRWADRVVLLTHSAIQFYPLAKGYKSVVIPNPLLTPDPAVPGEQLLPTPSLIAVGRLDPVKGFDLLLQAFARIEAKYPDWHLTILGEGEARSQLEALRTELELTHRVHLPGAVTNVNDYLRQSEIFVLSSRFEGFPMGLCEAMACGVPVMATDCLSGPRDIIQEGIDGILVPMEDVEALATGLDDLMSDPDRREKLAQAAPQVLARFGLERVMAIWNDTIKQTLARRTD